MEEEEEEHCFEEKILCKSPKNYAADFSVDRTEQQDAKETFKKSLSMFAFLRIK